MQTCCICVYQIGEEGVVVLQSCLRCQHYHRLGVTLYVQTSRLQPRSRVKLRRLHIHTHTHTHTHTHIHVHVQQYRDIKENANYMYILDTSDML